MLVTCRLFEAYLKCPTKCFLRSADEKAPKNSYAEWIRLERESYTSEGIKRVISGIRQDAIALDQLDLKNLHLAGWHLAVNQIARTSHLESIIHVVERVSRRARNNFELIPIRFVATNNLNKDDKLLLAFDAIVLSQILGSEVGIGKIIHGEDHATTIVNTGVLASNVWRLIAGVESMLSSNTPPDLVLNRHCPECEFQNLCRLRATEKDDLSLLSGMTGNERSRYRSKGIFTVTQLSYTFRPRRTPKRAKNPAKPRYLSLQALAIRENTTYIHGNPMLPDSKAQVYLDIEGLSDNSFYTTF